MLEGAQALCPGDVGASWIIRAPFLAQRLALPLAWESRFPAPAKLLPSHPGLGGSASPQEFSPTLPEQAPDPNDNSSLAS